MKIAYFDCFAGISGDMIIGSFLDSGLDFNMLKSELDKLKLDDYHLKAEKVTRSNIAGTKFNVICNENRKKRSLNDIEKIINKSTLEKKIKKQSLEIFGRLARVEAAIHGKNIDEIYFHEIGAIDSIIDIVGTVISIKLLAIEKIYSSKIHVGTGSINTEHGRLPLPAPAAAELLKGIPVYSEGIGSELTTPTGAALISSLAEEFGVVPEMEIDSIGYGAGARDLEIPNMLRIFTGVTFQKRCINDLKIMLETNIDDMNPQFYQYVSERLFAAGAIDVYTVPIIMKKSRPGIILNVLSSREDADRLADIIFTETTSSGIRINPVRRKILEREIRSIETKYGAIKVKIHISGDKVINISPEYEDCAEKARQNGAPVKKVYDEAKESAQKQIGINYPDNNY